MSDQAKRKINQAFLALQFGAVVAVGYYFAYTDGLRDGSRTSPAEEVGSDLPADPDGDSGSSPKSTSLDGE